MSAPNDGGPAFPHEFKFGDGTAERANGLSLRDYFAAKAMQLQPWHDIDGIYEEHADRCYSMADAMLKARQS